MREIKGLSFELNKRYNAAIDAGFLDDYEENPAAWRHTFVGCLLRRYPRRVSTLKRLRNLIGNVPTWEDMTDELLRDFIEDCQDEGMTQSSLRTVCAELKAIINMNRKKVPSEDYREILSIRNEASEAVYLTREELLRIINYTTINDIERYVRRNFIVAFLTGARISDAQKFTVHNCDIETGTLSYVPQKTPGIIVTVPVDERLHLRDFLADTRRRHCGTNVFNDTIRRICRECHIDTVRTIHRKGQTFTLPKWEFVSAHTARRSFATNLFLAGVSIEDIAMLMGHGKNIETTKRYICAERQISSNVMAYFQPREEEVLNG